MTDPSYQPNMALSFLSSTLPFSELAPEVLSRLARECIVDFVPENTVVFQRGVTKPKGLFLVQKGGVRLTGTNSPAPDAESKDARMLADVRGEGAGVGAVALLEGGEAVMDVETVEDTFFIIIPRKVFLELVEQQPIIGQYYVRGLPERFVSQAFAEMRLRCEGIADEKGLYLFANKAGDLVSRPAEVVARGTSLRQAAARMVEAGVGSLLVSEIDSAGDGQPEMLGIVTDSDLRKAVSLCMDYEAPVETLMSSPVISVEAERPCFDALLEMMRLQIHHLAVARKGQIVGVITAHDIMVMQGRTPLSLFREIMHQRTLEGLYPLGKRMVQVARGLVEEGAKAGAITRMITVFNDLILEKVLSLLQQELGPPPMPFAWMCMGSEGRREQTFVTDQDNALVLGNTDDPIIQSAANIYFTAFAERAVEHLSACGFQLCPGDTMVSNPAWRMNLNDWKSHFSLWIRKPEPQELRNATIFFDFRSGYGRQDFVEELRTTVQQEAMDHDVFLRQLADDCLAMRPPLTFFRNFIVEKDGEHKNTLDLKKRGAMPFVDFARVMALKHGITETNTLDRFIALESGGHIPATLGQEAREAYEFVMHLRLLHQVTQAEQGEAPDNNINPATLSELEKRTLKEAFAVAGRLQSFLSDVFRLNT